MFIYQRRDSGFEGVKVCVGEGGGGVRQAVRTEQNRIFIGVNSIYKGLLPKQHIKNKTKKLLNTIKLHIHV